MIKNAAIEMVNLHHDTIRQKIRDGQDAGSKMGLVFLSIGIYQKTIQGIILEVQFSTIHYMNL